MAFETALSAYSVDLRLISAVQTHAGARCHEAAGLLSCYALWTELHRQAVAGRDVDEAQRSRKALEDGEAKLRRFLFQCRSPQRWGASAARGDAADGSGRRRARGSTYARAS
jgi:hypothetical protein